MIEGYIVVRTESYADGTTTGVTESPVCSDAKEAVNYIVEYINQRITEDGEEISADHLKSVRAKMQREAADGETEFDISDYPELREYLLSMTLHIDVVQLSDKLIQRIRK